LVNGGFSVVHAIYHLFNELSILATMSMAIYCFYIILNREKVTTIKLIKLKKFVLVIAPVNVALSAASMSIYQIISNGYLHWTMLAAIIVKVLLEFLPVWIFFPVLNRWIKKLDQQQDSGPNKSES
jgi:hypothetical protein